MYEVMVNCKRPKDCITKYKIHSARSLYEKENIILYVNCDIS